MKVLITGSNGLLGTDLVAAFIRCGHEPIATTRTASEDALRLDITVRNSIEHVLDFWKPDCVVNAAAFTAVDLAESNYQSAFSVNAEGVLNLAEQVSVREIPLVHISTDYVFGGGTHTEPLLESEAGNPLGVYGVSKYYGELFIRHCSSERSTIVRTSWLHGLHGKNFIDTILQLATQREVLQVVDDQVGSLTWSPWLSDCIVGLVQQNARGVYHASSVGEVSWCEVAREVCRQAGLATIIEAVPTEAFPRPAPRPKYSALNTEKLRATLNIPPFSWRDSIREHLSARGVLTDLSGVSRTEG